MKVLVATDFHGVASAFEAFSSEAEKEHVDLMVLCGDITHFGTLEHAIGLMSLLVEPRIPIVFVPGNCDPPSLIGVDIPGATCIHGKKKNYGDLTFIGIGGSPPTPFHTPFELTEQKIEDVLNGVYETIAEDRKLILVSHTPPSKTNLDKTFLGEHAGSRSVRAFIEKRKPMVVFCGHIHEGKGRDRIGRTTILNPGPAKHRNFAEISIDEDFTFKFDFL